MEEKKNEKKKKKTRKGIKAALVTYLAQKELSRITVREISETADINRATFYAHYLDVYDLYEKVEQEILMDWSALILRMEDLDHKDFFSALIRYVGENKDVFAMVFSPKSPGELRVKLYKALEGLFRQITAEKQDTNLKDDRLAFRIRYRAEGCMAILCKWAEDGFRQPEDFIVQVISELDDNTQRII